MVGDLREYTEALTGRLPAEDFVAQSGSPSRRSAVVNAQHLVTVQERDMGRLAEMLRGQAEQYLAAAADADETADILTPNGLVVTPPIMTSLLLGEQLVHGLDIARAARETWSISHRDALLVLPGALATAPRYLRPSVGHDVDVSYELRIRGGGRYRMAVRNGVAEVHRRRREGRLRDHRRSGSFPATGLRANSALAASHWRQDVRFGPQTLAGGQVRHPAQ